MSSKNYRVLSLDVSSTCTGWSFITNRKNSLKFGTIRPNNKDSLPIKLSFFRQELIKILKEHEPNQVVIEDTFMGTNPKITKLLAKFGGVAEQVTYEYVDVIPFIVGNTKPKSFFKVKKKEQLFDVIIDLVDFGLDDMAFKEWNDVADSTAQLLCYCDEILNIKKVRQEKEYGFRYKF